MISLKRNLLPDRVRVLVFAESGTYGSSHVWYLSFLYECDVLCGRSDPERERLPTAQDRGLHPAEGNLCLQSNGRQTATKQNKGTITV